MILPHAYLTWNESTESLVTFLRYQVYRRKTGETAWVRLVRINIRETTYYADYTVQSGQEYEYAVTQVKDTSGEDVESLFPTPVSVTVSFKNAFVHAVGAPHIAAEIPHQAVDVQHQQEVAYTHALISTAPVAHIGPRNSLQIGINTRWPHTEDSIWDNVKALVDRQLSTALPLCIRTGRGVRAFCVLSRNSRNDQRPSMSTHALQFQEVLHTEQVA